MSEVLIDDLSLNNIANSIRGKNGLVRTYKPRDMAPAIRAFNNYIAHPHEYRVTINQTPHQQITVKKLMNSDRRTYDGTFTVSEPYYNLYVNIDADIGYLHGVLNCGETVVLDRDLIIEATPAQEYSGAGGWTTVYANGSRTNAFYALDNWLSIYSDEQCTNRVDRSISGKIRLIDLRHNITTGHNLLGIDNENYTSPALYVTELSTNLDTSGISTFDDAFRKCYGLFHITTEDWDMRNVVRTSYMFYNCSSLFKIDASKWDMNNLVNANNMFDGCGSLTSLDLANWGTENLINAGSMFSNCGSLRALDISNWKTGNIESMTMPPNLRYLIMDADEVKFSGEYIFANPNNKVKYLVPSTMLNTYKNHENWQSRASQIYDITDFNIVRYSGRVEVNPNI